MDASSDDTTDLLPGSSPGSGNRAGAEDINSAQTVTARSPSETATVTAAAATATMNAAAPTATVGVATSGSNSSGPQISLGDSAQAGVLRSGTVIRDRFEIVDRLGSGGMGVVYKALDRNKEKFRDRNPYVAIKVLGDNVRDRSTALMALQREATRAQNLAHPNIVTVYDFDTYADTLFVSMELLEGQSLDKLIKSIRGEGMSLKQALPIITGMAAALGHAHSKGVVHCDFKPGNVYLTKKDEIKVLDFGIARLVDREKDQQQAMDQTFDAGMLNALTPAYASCEMIERKPPDPRDDIYALACVTYELLVGKHPYNRYPATQARTLQMYPDRAPGLSRRQWDTLRSALSFDGVLRPATTDAFMRGLRDERTPLARPSFWFALVGAIVFAVGASAVVTGYLTRPDATTAGIADQPPRELTPDDREKISRLLGVVDTDLELGFISSPPGNNALETLIQVLEIDPSNAKAKEFRKIVMAKAAEEAQLFMAKGEPQAAVEIVNLGLAAEPGNSQFRQLKDTLSGK